MSKTPETDALISVGLENADRECVPADFARRLERERDEAMEEIEALRHEYHGAKAMAGGFKDKIKSLTEQRDEAMEQAQRLRVQLNHYSQVNEMAEQAFRERGEARKIAEQAIDDLAWFNESNAQVLRNELEQIKENTK